MTSESITYGDHELQSVRVFHTPPPGPDDGDAVWIIYIHGGAWRDPNITDQSFLSTVIQLRSDPVISHIKGIASISYRLSPHPDFPQEPSTPAEQLRRAVHPDHVNDVVSALAVLHAKYKFGNRYFLIGHSCGATLAFQATLDQASLHVDFPKPRVIIGVAGIYDLRSLRDNHSHPAYESFLTGAFGKNESVWDRVSPGMTVDIERRWSVGQMVVLATSTNDELVESAQIDDMQLALITSSSLRVEVWRNYLSGSHDEIWQTGELAIVIRRAIEIYCEGRSAISQ